MMIWSQPAASASSTPYWMMGLSTSGSISFGCALVAGRKRVPSPAAGKTALRTFFFMASGSGSVGRGGGRERLCYDGVKAPFGSVNYNSAGSRTWAGECSAGETPASASGGKHVRRRLRARQIFQHATQALQHSFRLGFFQKKLQHAGRGELRAFLRGHEARQLLRLNDGGGSELDADEVALAL